MRLTVLYPAAQQAFADSLNLRLCPIRGLDVAWVATSAEDFVSELADAAQDDEPLIVAIDSTLLEGKPVPPRVRWAPLLKRIESGQASSVGLVLLSQLDIPQLLRKAMIATDAHPARSVIRWVIGWLGLSSNLARAAQDRGRWLTGEAIEDLMGQLVDRSGLARACCECEFTRVRTSAQIAQLLAPYFEAVHLIHAPHRTKALRDAELSRIIPSGRSLWIVTTEVGEVPELPEHASMLVIAKSGGIEIAPDGIEEPQEDPIARAVSLIPLIPTVEGIALPFSTYELECLLPQLFSTHWSLAERLARRAGSFFRINHRVPEAIWIYETLKWQATLQGQTPCATDCENELYWLRAGGARKQGLAAATQTGFDF